MKKAISIILGLCFVISVCLVGKIAVNEGNADSFRKSLTEIYREYDANADKEDKSEFALKRLIVSDFDGDTYGAVSSAVDEKNADAPHRRDFYAELYYGREYIIEECGFIYGKNMPDDVFTYENIGYKNPQGLQLKNYVFGDNNMRIKVLTYGSSTKDGYISARFYIKYSNGVKSYITYSDITKYDYEN